ncbi:NYN domain-containing protein [Candidatus Acidulodesulfobacterium sp. H_13]|uniref:NYN domain-containing protein n=1 Tax=Candidatus Acidulodesulfobacterium sp. H_13 TaxID=3395470 RepID=UPI003AF71705
MITIIIDGYNFIFNSYFKLRFKSDELQKLRELTINFLSKYYNVKRNKVIVVFDGYNTDEPYESAYNRQNIEIIYSKKDEKADDVIVRLAKSIGNSIVVTNDNEIRRHVSGVNCSCMSIGEFEKIIENIINSDNNGSLSQNYEDEEDETARRHGMSSEKKGNPHKLSKKDRLKMKKIRKI